VNQNKDDRRVVFRRIGGRVIPIALAGSVATNLVAGRSIKKSLTAMDALNGKRVQAIRSGQKTSRLYGRAMRKIGRSMIATKGIQKVSFYSIPFLTIVGAGLLSLGNRSKK